MRTRRILVITGDHDLPDATKQGMQYGPEDLKAHRIMTDAFGRMAGFDVSVWNDHAHILDGLRKDPPDLVVNFCDTGYRNIATQEIVLPCYLEMLGIAYTGAPPAAMTICYDKQIVRLVASALGIATPREFFLKGAKDDDLPDVFPALIKPNRGDGSVGITKDAVVRDEREVRAYLAWIRSELPGADVLYQEYLPGPEYGIGLIGNPHTALRVLPPLEVDFSALPDGLNPILSFESKTLPSSPYWNDIKFKRASLDGDVLEKLEQACRVLFERVGLRDYGRFDFRCGADGEPKLMEVNPNPAWGYDGKLAIMSEFAGLNYGEMLRAIVDAALERIARNA